MSPRTERETYFFQSPETYFPRLPCSYNAAHDLGSDKYMHPPQTLNGKLMAQSQGLTASISVGRYGHGGTFPGEHTAAILAPGSYTGQDAHDKRCEVHGFWLCKSLA